MPEPTQAHMQAALERIGTAYLQSEFGLTELDRVCSILTIPSAPDALSFDNAILKENAEVASSAAGT